MGQDQKCSQLIGQNVNIVYVGTPHVAHYDDAKLVLEAGKHCLLEKVSRFLYSISDDQLADDRACHAQCCRVEGSVTHRNREEPLLDGRYVSLPSRC